MADERGKMLESAIAQIEKTYGKGAIMRLGNRDVLVPVSVIPTGALSLDAALGVGGMRPMRASWAWTWTICWSRSRTTASRRWRLSRR